MTFPTAARETLFTSVSQVKSYLACPKQFFFRYVLRADPEFTPVSLAFGSAFHHGLATYYTGIKRDSVAPPLQAIQQAFRDSWIKALTGPVPVRMSDEDREDEKHIDKGMEMLAAFYAHAETSPCPIVESVETPFSVALHDPDTGELLEEQLVGVFDLVLRHPETTQPIIVEHKSAARRWSADQLVHDLQVSGYSYAAEKLGLAHAALRLQIVTKAKTPSVQIEDVTRTAGDIGDFLQTVIGTLRAIDAGAFYPIRGPLCRGCPFQHHCTSLRRT